MKRFKMGVLNNFQTHKLYSTNRKIIYRENPEKIKPPEPKPSNPFGNIPKPPIISFSQFSKIKSSKTLINQNEDLKWEY